MFDNQSGQRWTPDHKAVARRGYITAIFFFKFFINTLKGFTNILKNKELRSYTVLIPILFLPC